MAQAKLNSLLKELHGKLCKAEDQVFYGKFGKVFVWNNRGNRKFNAAQLQAQANMATAAAQVATIMASTTQKATYMAAFKAQSKYKTFRGYLMADAIDQINSAGND